ncbi:hypothetical protein CC79DRAFT_696249 [Sarocladium strictum]
MREAPHASKVLVSITRQRAQTKEGQQEARPVTDAISSCREIGARKKIVETKKKANEAFVDTAPFSILDFFLVSHYRSVAVAAKSLACPLFVCRICGDFMTIRQRRDWLGLELRKSGGFG